MAKCALQLAVCGWFLVACSSEPAGDVGPQAVSALPSAGSGGASGQALAPQQASVETSRPTATAGNVSASAGRPAAPASTQTAGAAETPVAGAPSTETPACDQDPLTVLRGLAPADEDLAKDYEKYLTGELGKLTCATAGTGNARTLTQTIYVPPNATYDGRGETLTADAAAMRCDTSEGEQGESQQPIFVLAKGAQVKNVTIAYPGCEGVHMLGDNVLENVKWIDAGEDAASVRSYFPGGKITIRDSEGHKAADKMFQFNAPCDVRIENFTGSDMGKLVRQNGGTEFALTIDLNNVNLTGVISAVVQSDSPLCTVRHHALSYMFTGSGDKSDRVFRDIPATNVTEY